MTTARRTEPMPVKHWSSAGILLTYWCNARCASCYLRCGPRRRRWIGPALAVRIWGELIAASPHGCRVHLTGGEPFGNYELLLAICRAAHEAGLGPLAKIETNAFWATDETTVRQRLRELDAAGMRKLAVSADPYHQQFVPIERCRLLARLAESQLGPDRVQVRWRDWLRDGQDTGAMDDATRWALFAEYARTGRDRFNGRAAETIGSHVQPKPTAEFADSPCREALLRCKHVHVDPDGLVMAGTCAGILLGDCRTAGVGEIWRRLWDDHASRPIVGPLSRHGPVALVSRAQRQGFRPRAGYASKCHLCWHVRSFLHSRDVVRPELGPDALYGPHGDDAGTIPKTANQ